MPFRVFSIKAVISFGLSQCVIHLELLLFSFRERLNDSVIVVSLSWEIGTVLFKRPLAEWLAFQFWLYKMMDESDVPLIRNGQFLCKLAFALRGLRRTVSP